MRHLLSEAQLAQIDALYEAMDREAIWARVPTGHGRTMLDEARDYWTQCALSGRPLPERWGTDAEHEQVEARFAAHGTREWRKAYPGWVGAKKWS